MPSDQNRRRSPRQGVAYKVFVESGSGFVECRLVDISDVGVRIELPEDISVAPEFMLRLSSMANYGRGCEVIWRSSNELGANFLTSMSATHEMPEDEEPLSGGQRPKDRRRRAEKNLAVG